MHVFDDRITRSKIVLQIVYQNNSNVETDRLFLLLPQEDVTQATNNSKSIFMVRTSKVHL